MPVWSQWTTCWGRVGDTSSHHRQSYRHGYEFALFMPEAMISYLLGIGSSQSQKHSYSFEDARILFYCYATASYAVLLSLTTSCAATCQTQPASSERRLALLEREGHGLPVKVEYVGTAGQQPFILQYGWRPGSAQEKFFFLVQVAQTKANYGTYDESNSAPWKQRCDCMADTCKSPTHHWIGKRHVHPAG